MANQTPPAQPQPQWFPSPNYRLIHSNLFRYRINAGEITIHFDSLTDLGLAPTMSAAAVAEVSVAMSWPQMKALALTLDIVTRAIEERFGAIQMTVFPPNAVALEEDGMRKVLQMLYGPPST